MHSRLILILALICLAFPAYAAEESIQETCGSGDTELQLRIKACTQIIEDGSEDESVRADSLASRASAHREAGDEKAAMADYSRAIELEPLFGRSRRGRGLGYLTAEKYDLAIADFKLAGLSDPDVLLLMGLAYDGNKKPEEAMGWFNAAIEANPSDWSYYYSRGKSYLKIENYDLALKDLHKALELRPSPSLKREIDEIEANLKRP